MFFFVISKNFNWEILTKNLVTFERWDGVNDEKLQFTEKFNFQKEGLTKNYYSGSIALKRGDWTV